MKTILLLCLPLLVQAQFLPVTDKPLNLQCSHAKSTERWIHASLDAESLHTYDQLDLQLTIRVENGDFPLSGTAELTLVSREALTDIPLNAEGLEITAVRVDGLETPYMHAEDTLHVMFNVPIEDTITIAVDYSAAPNPDWNDSGFQTGWEQAYTFSEPYGARRWYPCWDQPSDKFNHVRITVNMPEPWTLAANGSLENTEHPETGRIEQTYEHDLPISTYLVHFAAGNFSNQVFAEGGVQYRYFAWPRSDSAQAAYDFERTPQMVSLFSNLFGDYPFEQYGMVMTDIFGGWGAMEHQTFTTYGFNLVDSARTFEGIVAHELAHQWFGDHLSPVDFRNMWLNEGFATYGDVLWAEHLNGDNGLNDAMRTLANACINEENNFPPSYPVYDPPADRLFGVNVYYKGAWVLHMLRKQILGDSLFFAVMQDYVATFGGGNVDTDDFINVTNEHYDGPDVNWFFDQWVYGLGIPAIEVTFILEPEEEHLQVIIHQTQSTGYFHFPIIVEQGDQPNIERLTLWTNNTEWSEWPIVLRSMNVHLAEDQIALFDGVVLDATPREELPNEFTVSPAYPNPFNPSITIPLSLNVRANVELTLFDVTGRIVATIFKGELGAGKHSLNYQAPATLAAGVYLLRASNGTEVRTQKVLLLK